MKRLFVLLILLFFFKVTHATDLAGRAISMVIQPNTLMSINGNLFVGSNLTFKNQGNLYIQQNIQIDSLGLLQGSGHYFLNGNWTNNGEFVPDSSILHLNTATHFMKGKSQTRFYDVSIAPSSYVYQSASITILDTLNLGNAVWNVGSDTLQLLNTDSAHLKVLSVANLIANNNRINNGYFSGTPKGCVLRSSIRNQKYFYPFGDSLFSGFYRRIILSSSDTSNHLIGGMLIHQNFQQYNWSDPLPDSTVCAVDTNWYFLLAQRNAILMKTSNATLPLSFLSCALEDNFQTDGFFNSLANFDNANKGSNNNPNFGGAWEILPTARIISTFNPNPKTQFLNATLSSSLLHLPTSSNSNLPISLAKIRPIMAPLSGNFTPCINTTATYSLPFTDHFDIEARLDSQLLPFVIYRDSIYYSILWNGKLNPILHFTLKDSTNQCSSSINDYPIMIHTGPHANYGYRVIQRAPIQTIQFQDSSLNSNHWLWDFGNNTTGTVQNPFIGYPDPGNYWVKEMVTDQFGCKDSLSKEVVVPPNLFIPNVFTPNGDGVNDEFIIDGLGASLQSLRIFNRWGSEVYSASTAPNFWNGLNLNGEPCPEGTYFYIAEIKWGVDAITFSANNTSNINQGGQAQSQNPQTSQNAQTSPNPQPSQFQPIVPATPESATQVYKGNITLLR